MAGAVGRRDSERMFHVKHFWMTGPGGASAGDGQGAVLLQKMQGECPRGVSEQGSEKRGMGRCGNRESPAELPSYRAAEPRGRGVSGLSNRGERLHNRFFANQKTVGVGNVVNTTEERRSGW